MKEKQLISKWLISTGFVSWAVWSICMLMLLTRRDFKIPPRMFPAWEFVIGLINKLIDKWINWIKCISVFQKQAQVKVVQDRHPKLNFFNINLSNFSLEKNVIFSLFILFIILYENSMQKIFNVSMFLYCLRIINT